MAPFEDDKLLYQCQSYLQVKVWLQGVGQEDAHYYVMSRYLTCRMLTVTKIAHQKVKPNRESC